MQPYMQEVKKPLVLSIKSYISKIASETLILGLKLLYAEQICRICDFVMWKYNS